MTGFSLIETAGSTKWTLVPMTGKLGELGFMKVAGMTTEEVNQALEQMAGVHGYEDVFALVKEKEMAAKTALENLPVQ